MGAPVDQGARNSSFPCRRDRRDTSVIAMLEMGVATYLKDPSSPVTLRV
jgi:hypothetical protein